MLGGPPACPAELAGALAEPDQAVLEWMLQQLPCHLLQYLLPVHKQHCKLKLQLLLLCYDVAGRAVHE